MQNTRGRLIRLKSYVSVQKWNLTYQTLRNEVNCCNFRGSELDNEGTYKFWTNSAFDVLPSYLEVRCLKNSCCFKISILITNLFLEICLHNWCSTLIIWDSSWILEHFGSNLYRGFVGKRTPPHYRADWPNDQKLSVQKFWGVPFSLPVLEVHQNDFYFLNRNHEKLLE